MNDLSLEDLIKPTTADDAFATLEAIMTGLGTNPSRYRRGGALRVLMRAQSMTFAGLTEIMVAVVRSGFLDLAEGGWLTLLARYVFGVTRRPAQPASGKVKLTNTGGATFAPGDYPIGSVRLFSSRTGKKYFNAEAVDLGPTTTIELGVVAVESGSESNALVGDIDSLETSLLGVEVTNDEPILALDEESDVELRIACRSKLASLSGLGPRGAYQWAVREAKRLDGTPTAINRVYVPEGSWTAIVDVILASASGAPISGDVDAAIASIESMARPSGIKVQVASAVEVPDDRLVTIWVQRTNGLNLAAIRAEAELAIPAGLRTYPIGGIRKPDEPHGALYSDWIKGRCKVHPAVFDVDLSDETDRILAPNEVATWAGYVHVRAA